MGSMVHIIVMLTSELILNIKYLLYIITLWLRFYENIDSLTMNIPNNYYKLWTAFRKIDKI